MSSGSLSNLRACLAYCHVLFIVSRRLKVEKLSALQRVVKTAYDLSFQLRRMGNISLKQEKDYAESVEKILDT